MRAAVLLCLLVVLAGCADPGVGGPATPTSDRGPDSTPTAAPDARSTPTPDGRSTSARPSGVGTDAGTVTDASNPWNADPVTVGIEAPDDDDRDYRPLVRRTLAFWENESTGYDLDYRLVDDADPDVTVRFVANVTATGCAGARSVGCAPGIPKGGRAPAETVVRIETGYTDASTLATLKHELGHTLGYDHDDTDAYGFMAARGRVTRLAVPNATGRANPWGTAEIGVYVDYPDVVESQRAEYEEAVARALAFYRTDEASTLPAGARLVETDDRAAADVVIEFSGTGERRSIGDVRGYDDDADPALERYTRYRIRVDGIDRDRIAWHVGHWLGWAFGAASADDLPEPFDDPETDDRENW